jgi:hypothetical protein
MFGLEEEDSSNMITPKNKWTIRKPIKPADKCTGISIREEGSEDESPLPDQITLPDGRIFTNQEIVSLKRLAKHSVRQSVLEEIENYLADNPKEQVLTRPLIEEDKVNING